eukprot:g19194.t1
MANLGKWDEFSEVKYHQKEVEMPSEDGLVEDAWTDMAEAPDLKSRMDAHSWEERMPQMRADWKGSEEDLKPRPGTVKHYDAHLRKIPGMNITHASRRSSLGRREESPITVIHSII